MGLGVLPQPRLQLLEQSQFADSWGICAHAQSIHPEMKRDFRSTGTYNQQN
jgi:hypothetical protein